MCVNEYSLNAAGQSRLPNCSELHTVFFVKGRLSPQSLYSGCPLLTDCSTLAYLLQNGRLNQPRLLRKLRPDRLIWIVSNQICLALQTVAAVKLPGHWMPATRKCEWNFPFCWSWWRLHETAFYHFIFRIKPVCKWNCDGKLWGCKTPWFMCLQPWSNWFVISWQFAVAWKSWPGEDLLFFEREELNLLKLCIIRHYIVKNRYFWRS